MGRRQEKLKEVVTRKFGESNHEKLTQEELEKSLFLDSVATVYKVYKNLKGRFENLPL